MDNNSPPVRDETSREVSDEVPEPSLEELRKETSELVHSISEAHAELDEEIAKAKQLLAENAGPEPLH